MSTVSACLIVKDEAARLPRCLASLAEAVDEIVVVDTGSSDETRELARSFGARVGTFHWSDDFSAARNAALDLATGDWVLVIDADEWLRPGGAAALRAACDDPAVVAYKLALVNHLDGDRREEESLTRLFRRDPRVRFAGRVHEQVTESLAQVATRPGAWPELRGVTIEHDGYLKSIVRERDKSRRNVALLSRAVDEAPRDPYLRYKLAGELGPERGLPHLEIALERLLELPVEELRRRPWAEQALINGALQLSARPGVVLAIARAASGAFGEHPALLLAQARAELASGHPADAFQTAERAERCPPRGPSYDAAALAGELCHTLGEAALRCGRWQVALDRLLAAQRALPGSSAVTHSLIELAIAVGDLKAALRLGLGHLKEHPRDTRTLELCAVVAERCGDTGTAERWRVAARAA